MPRKRRACFVFMILALGIVCLFQLLGFWEEKFPLQRDFVYRLRDGDESHPVEHLHAAAKKQFVDLLSRQSITAADAMVEYRRRYGRRPPPGFERWFTFAKEHDLLIVDDYDEMMRSLEPFWKIAPTDVSRLMERANSTEQTLGYIKKCSIVQGALTDCGAWASVMSRSWSLEEELRSIADMTFIINYMDEPAVLAGHPTANGDSDEKFMWSKTSRQPTWPRCKTSVPELASMSSGSPPQPQRPILSWTL